jgi:hypothetical protein
MSVRAERKQHGNLITAELKEVRESQQALAAKEKALVTAQAALAEMPRPSEPSDYLLEYIPVHPASVEQGHCGICGESSIGWQEKWTCCPVCGNPITAKRETLDGQGSRSAREDVCQAFRDQQKGDLWPKTI